jgi:hypothetical protein
VVFVKDAARFREVEFVVGRFPPRKFEHGFEVGARHLIIGRLGGQALHTAQFALGFLANVVGQIGGFQSLAQHFGFGFFAAFIVAEFLLNRFELLAQEILALRFVHFTLRFGRNLRAQTDDLDFACEARVSDAQEFVGRVGFEHLLLLRLPEV